MFRERLMKFNSYSEVIILSHYFMKIDENISLHRKSAFIFRSGETIKTWPFQL